MGCLRRIGCLVVIVLTCVGAYTVYVYWRGGHPAAPPAKAAGAAQVWEPVTPEGAARARAQLENLSKPAGPVFANIGPGDLASLVFEMAPQLPASVQTSAATIVGDRLLVRATVEIRDFGPDPVPSWLEPMLGKRTRVEFGGTIEIVRPGFAQYRVTSLKLGDIDVPEAAITKLLDHFARKRVAGAPADAVPFAVPRFIADVRVHGMKVTVYRSGT